MPKVCSILKENDQLRAKLNSANITITELKEKIRELMTQMSKNGIKPNEISLQISDKRKTGVVQKDSENLL